MRGVQRNRRTEHWCVLGPFEQHPYNLLRPNGVGTDVEHGRKGENESMTGRRDVRGVESAGDPPDERPREAPMSPASYPHLLDQVPAIIYVADSGEDGRWHYVSPQIETILGYTPQEWCAAPKLWASRLHPDDRARILDHEASIHAGRLEPSAYEYRLLDRGGRAVWIRDDAILVADIDGVRRWHGVLSDVTEKKAFEAELERRADQQSAVARLGEHGLEGATTAELMHEAVSAAKEILGADMAAVFELLAEENVLVARSGVPAPPSGGIRVPGGTESQAGYTIDCGAPVVVSDWETETRFANFRHATEMQTRSGVTVPIVSR